MKVHGGTGKTWQKAQMGAGGRNLPINEWQDPLLEGKLWKSSVPEVKPPCTATVYLGIPNVLATWQGRLNEFSPLGKE